MSDERCATCRFWGAVREKLCYTPERASCLRFPPPSSSEAYPFNLGLPPLTREHDWCGEYQGATE